MRKRNRLAAVAATAVAVLAIGPAAALSAGGAGEIIKVTTTVTLGASGYQGKVSATNPNCVAERTVVLKQKGVGVLSRVTSRDNGSWKADLEDLNAKIKIPAKVFAEVKASTQATAGPIYKCAAATSKTREIAGG